MIALYFVIPTALEQMFNPTAEPATPIGKRTNVAEIKTHTVKAKKWLSGQYDLKLYKLFCVSCLLYFFGLFYLQNNFLFYLFFWSKV